MNYQEIQNIVNELLPEFGIECTATVRVKGQYDPKTGLSGSEKITKGQAVITSIDMRYGGQNNLIEVGDQWLLATASLDLQVGSIVNIEGKKYQVISPNPIKMAKSVILYKAHIRKI